MATIREDIITRASAAAAWSALRDVGALHTRLVPGFGVAAGADISTPGDGEPVSLIAMAERNPVVQAALRRHGAKE